MRGPITSADNGSVRSCQANSANKLKLLHVVNTLNPAYGGCVEAVRQTALAQSGMGHEVGVLTLDGPEVEWLKHFKVPVIALGQGPSGRFGYNRRLVPWLRVRRSEYDAFVLHGIWDYASLGAWRALHDGDKPYFIYAHGMLDPWFERFRAKHLKKSFYWKLCAHRIFRDARGVLFTSEQERRLAGSSFRPYSCREIVVPLGSSRIAPEEERFAVGFLSHYPHLREKRLVLFFGRIHPKKGAELLIRAFAAVAPRFPGLHLVMAGPDTEGFGEPLRKLSVEMKIDGQLTWTGLLNTPQLRFGALHAADVFVLPSHSENFGFAVVEALARGVPVLISKRVNIWREIIADNAGFAENDDLTGTTDMLTRWLFLSDEARSKMRCNAVRCFEKRFEVSLVTEELMRLLTTSVRSPGSPRPAGGHTAGTPR
jgi:glycosyltransferase involved in cell wall biosynthesis